MPLAKPGVVVAPPPPSLFPGVIRAPAKKAVRGTGVSAKYTKTLVFGPPGTGKTHCIASLLRMGKRVAVISTDIGETGLATIRAELMGSGDEGLLDNMIMLPAESFEDVVWLVGKPSVPPNWLSCEIEGGATVADFDPNWLVWDGFSNFQIDMVGGMVRGETDHLRAEGSAKGISQLRTDGYAMEQSDWGVVFLAAYQAVNAFLGLRGAGGKPLNKLVTCMSQVRQKQAERGQSSSGEFITTHHPMVQGQLAASFGGGFDIILRTGISADGEYRLIAHEKGGTGGSLSKRGIPLPAKIPNFSVVSAAIDEFLAIPSTSPGT